MTLAEHQLIPGNSSVLHDLGPFGGKRERLARPAFNMRWHIAPPTFQSALSALAIERGNIFGINRHGRAEELQFKLQLLWTAAHLPNLGSVCGGDHGNVAGVPGIHLSTGFELVRRDGKTDNKPVPPILTYRNAVTDPFAMQ